MGYSQPKPWGMRGLTLVLGLWIDALGSATFCCFFAQVIVENVSQPTLDNLYEALGRAYGLPANRVWAIKHNWSKHEWVRFTREMGIKKVNSDN